MQQTPWVSFCISTFQRPVILKDQLQALARQTFPHFEVIVSDNDPDGSAKPVVEQMEDPRFRYFHNGNNLGMIRSFNKSIERASTNFIVMVTDDDPIEENFLETFHQLFLQYPGYSIYCGFQRQRKPMNGVEIIPPQEFVAEILDPGKTGKILWSSAVVSRGDALTIGFIPDYGSPHLADHAFIALAGAQKGGVVVNKMYSSLSSHDSNFSKRNLHYYLSGCEGFYKVMHAAILSGPKQLQSEKAISKHLGIWLQAVISSLRKYYTYMAPDKIMLAEANDISRKIIRLPFMKEHRFRFFIKNMTYRIFRLLRKGS